MGRTRRTAGDCRGTGKEDVTNDAIKAQANQAEDSNARLRGKQALLVEDNLINHQVARELPSQAGLVVMIAEHGARALEILEQQSFDAVLMDIQMPVMDGYTATRAIRDNAHFDNMPVIAMTANARSSNRIKVVQSSMNDHVAKPIDVATLFVTLEQHLTAA